jgi:hypothetical protein
VQVLGEKDPGGGAIPKGQRRKLVSADPRVHILLEVMAMHSNVCRCRGCNIPCNWQWVLTEVIGYSLSNAHAIGVP